MIARVARRGRRWLSRLTLAIVAAARSASARAASRGQPVTFTKDVAPIFQQKCQVCHQPNSIAPMSLITYEDARKFARADQDASVAARVMPPWHIDKTIGIQRVQERSQPDRRADRRRSSAGSTPARRWAIRRTCRRRPTFPDPTGWQLAEAVRRSPTSCIKSPPYTLAARTQDKWFRPGQRDRADRAALGARDRDQAVVSGRPPHRAPRADDARSRARRASPASRTARTTCRPTPACSWNGRSARSARSSPPTPAS